VALVAIIWGLFLPALALKQQQRWVRAIRVALPPLSLAFGFAAIALLNLTIDVQRYGEVLELMLGVLFLLGISMRNNLMPVVGPWWRPAALVTMLIVVGVVMVPMLDRFVYGDDTEMSRIASLEIELLRDDILKANIRRPFRKNRLRKRLFTAIRKGHIRFKSSPAFLKGHGLKTGNSSDLDRLKYFLDPWNNPYFIFINWKEGWALVYSYGPNRRFDTQLKNNVELGGDDIGATIPIRKHRQKRHLTQ
jgi:hypothetical protein